MNREEIMTILPHRGGMLLLDEAQLIDGVSHGKYLVRGDEWFLRGHFPDNPVVPGVILCEILAQSACALLAGADECGASHKASYTDEGVSADASAGASTDASTDASADASAEDSADASADLSGAVAPGSMTYYTGIDKARFRVPVRPGDTVETECELTRIKKPFYFARGSASVNGKLCASAEFSFAVTGSPG